MALTGCAGLFIERLISNATGVPARATPAAQSPHRFKKRRDETIGEQRRGTASLRAPPGRRLTVEGFVVSGLLGMLLAQLVGRPDQPIRAQ